MSGAREQRHSAYAMILAKRAATRLLELSGGRGQYLTAPIQRAFRDVQTGADGSAEKFITRPL